MPSGDVYTWYRRGQALLDGGDAAAAVQLLRRAAAAEPEAGSILEALARAEFDAGWYEDALGSFRSLAEREPNNDYALFGLGLVHARLGNFRYAEQLLGMAATMRPQTTHYIAALHQVRATLRSREEAGLDPARGTDESTLPGTSKGGTDS
jgi:tetratricopeptide (TPR) repeat protein